MRSFRKDILRSIRHTAGRFTAILLIVALGSGFYAGLRMAGGDMRAAGDAWVDGTHLYDLQLISTLGWDDEGIARIATADGVDAVMPVKSCDVMAEANDVQIATHISTIPDASRDSWSDDGTVVQAPGDDKPASVGARTSSITQTYLNRPVLAEGRWPAASDECVMSADCITRTPIEVGDTITVVYGAEDLDDVLEVRTFTVVGLVHSSTYITNASLGTTSIGDGDIDQCMFVPEEAFSEDRPYTEVFCTVSGARDEFAGSDEYWSIVDKAAAGLTDLAPALAEARYVQVRDDAQAEIDDGWVELEDARSEADEQISDAEQQLADALAKLEDGENELASARQQVEDGQAALDAARQQVADGRAQIDAAQQQIDDGRAQLSAAQQQVDDGKAQLEEGRAQLAAATAELEAAESEWQAQRADLVSQRDEAASQLAQLEQIPEEARTPEQQALIVQLRSVISQLDAGIAQGDAEIQAARDELAAGKAELDAKVAELDAAQAQLDSEAARLASAQNELDARKAQLAEGEEELEARSAQLAAARDEVARGAGELEDGWKEYRDGVSELETQRRDAEQEIADAEAELADAQAELDDLEVGSIYVLDRTKNIGVESFEKDAGRIDNIASIFPLFFFLVAALVALTTMTRMVDEERQLIGTYKALGYSRAKIVSKYLIYAGAASVVGAVLGISVLSQVLPTVVMKAYAIIYNTPLLPLPLAIDPKITAVAAGVGVGVTLLSTLVAVMASLREQPAALMLPRAPKAGRRILLERITPIWRRLSFSWKCTARNLFRYRRRLWMTLIGIAGCTALLLTGFGLHDSIWDIIEKQYEGDDRLVGYSVLVTMDEDAAEEDYAAVEERLAGELSDDKNAGIVLGARLDLQMGSEGAEPVNARVTVPEDSDALLTIITMRDRHSGNPVEFGLDSVVLSEKLANLLDVEVGDTVELYEENDIGDATGEAHPLVVTGITENYVGNECYIGPEAYAAAFGVAPDYRSLYLPGDPNRLTDQALVDELLAMEGVETVSTAGEVINTYRTLLQSVNAIVVVLVLAAAALCFVVLYNLANINITERRREIASLKVLGFTKREVHMYLYREIMLLVLIGTLIGLVFGTWLEGFVVVTAEVDYVMFGRDIHWLSYLFGFGCTIAFSVLVLLLLGRKIDAIDMAESLKSVE